MTVHDMSLPLDASCLTKGFEGCASAIAAILKGEYVVLQRGVKRLGFLSIPAETIFGFSAKEQRSDQDAIERSVLTSASTGA